MRQMSTIRFRPTLTLCSLLLLMPSWVLAQIDAVSVAYMQGKAPIAPDAIASLGPDMFGDKINLFNGSFSFEQTDVELPGNSALQVALIRQHMPGRSSKVLGALADWDLNTPRIEGTFPAAEGWIPWGGTPTNRCSGYAAPPGVWRGGYIDQETGATLPATDFHPWEYGQGVNLIVPGHGSQEILTRAAGYTLKPGDGTTLDYHLVTGKNWQIRCLQSLQNATGQGFVAVSPEGVRYTFDWMASRPQTLLMKGNATLVRRDFFLMATKVTDRFGNTVDYVYDATNPLNLTKIQSSDGRVIKLTYSNGRVSSVFDGTRTWQYLYSSQGDLQYVQQPDGSRWAFNLRALIYLEGQILGEYSSCDSMADAPGGEYTGTITHPSGATGTFTTMFLVKGRTDVQRACTYAPGSTWTTGAMWAKSTSNQALIGKQITGPGMATMNWTYADDGINQWGEWAPCSVCRDRKTVTVTEPGGGVTRHTFGIRWRINEGQLLRTEVGWNGTSALKTTTYNYRSASGQRFPDRFGDSTYFWSDWNSWHNRPQDLRAVNQQGVDFTWRVDPSDAGFDWFAQPQLVTSFSGLGPTRTVLTEYNNFLGLWVLGQVWRATETTTNQEIERHEYNNPSTAQKTASYEFGLLKQSYAYNADGTLATLSDQAGRPTVFQDFSRGRPQRAVFADQTVASRVGNNLGNSRSVTNEAGTTTYFDFDNMGRVAVITYPTGDPVAYFPTQQGFVQGGCEQFGSPLGLWRQTISNGTATTTRCFDEMWHPRLQVRQDTAMGGTSSYVETRYDAAGRKVFESYPTGTFGQLNDPGRKGKTTVYDALNRVVQEKVDTELPNQSITTNEYLAGFVRQVTNPRNKVTQFAFQAFDAPTEDQITRISAPEGVTISIARDLFGKPLSINRGGNSATATRSYFYDGYQRLCKTIEPETGATVQAYDLAGNVAWRGSGLTLSNAPGCDQSSVPDARKVSFDYDARNRLTSTTYGDGSPGIARSYTADGQLAQIRSSYRVWTYGYYNRRLLASEQYTLGEEPAPGRGWMFNWRLDAHGNVDQLTDPWGAMAYEPNALGQPTKVSGYASYVTHHPNGAVASYTLNNGTTHSLTQNVRGLPWVSQDSGVVHDRTSYDANGNVAAIEDLQENVSTRSMGYDGLDRLTAANGSWGAGIYTYDTLDNLRSSTVGGRSLTHNIDANNRLSSLTGSQSISIGYDLNGNVTSRGGQTFNFDMGNRMQSAPGKVNLHIYDGHGRRSQSAMTDGTSRLYAYGMQGKLLFSHRSDQGHTRYVYLGDKLIAETQESATNYSHTDALGSPVAKTNSIGSLISRTRYEPYGATVAGSTNPTSIGFTGHVNEPETGLVYMQQRYYDPIAGRFLSVDPVVTDQKTGDHFNRYNYADNNPYKFVDPDGRNPVIAAIVRVLLAVGGKEAAKAGAREGARDAAKGAAGAARGEGAAARSEGTAGGDRAGKPFTPAGKEQVKSENAAQNGGQTTCSNCGQATVPAKQSESGVTPPKNETQVDHKIPQSKGGDGSPSNGQVLCRDCNLKKSDK